MDMTHVPADQPPDSSTVTTSRSQAHPNGVLVALLGALSLIGQLIISTLRSENPGDLITADRWVFSLFSGLALITWWIAARARKQILADPDVVWTNAGLVNAGYVMGIIGFVIFSALMSFFGWWELLAFGIRSTS